MPWSRQSRLTNAMELRPGAEPKAPNIGRIITGWGVGMEALGSPICDHAMKPPLITISGFAPKKAGFHKTKSASLPASTEPMQCAMPCAIAGLIVYLETYRLMRKLSLPDFSPGRG